MAQCSNCGAESPRVRSRWTEKGIQLPDECPQCAPQAFEKFSNPSDQKIWMGYEAHPNEYERAPDGGFDRKPEFRAEQEEKLRQDTAEEREAQAAAVAHKRASRRTHPMDAAELNQALVKAAQYAHFVQEGLTD